MPDSLGNFTAKEIQALEDNLAIMERLEDNYNRLQSIDVDVEDDRKQTRENIVKIKQLLKTYKPLVKE